MPGDNEQYLADQLDQIHRSMRQGDVDGVVRQVGHVRGESDSQTADTLMRLALDRELKESRKKIRIWTAAAIVLAVGAAITIAAAVSKMRLDTLTDTATTVTATVSSTVPVPVATAPTSSAVPPVPGPDGSNFTVLHELTDFTLGNAISCFNNVEGTLDIDDLAPNADKPTFSSCLSEFRFDVGRYIARMPSVAQPAAQECETQSRRGSQTVWRMDEIEPGEFAVCVVSRKGNVGWLKVVGKDRDRLALKIIVWKPGQR